MKTINIYKFDELNESAQHKVYENSNIDFSDDYSSEYIATLEAFEKIFDIRVLDYTPDRETFRYIALNEAPEGDALRLARYLWNNYAKYITKGKYYSTPGKMIKGRYTYKHRYSKIIVGMEDCTLTGVCTDLDILRPVIDCLHYKKMYDSYDELIDDCLTGFFAAWNAESEYCNSFEYFKEYAIMNDDNYYTENGERVKGVA